MVTLRSEQMRSEEIRSEHGGRSTEIRGCYRRLLLNVDNPVSFWFVVAQCRCVLLFFLCVCVNS